MNSIAINVIALIAAQALHLYEEVRTGFRRRFPLGEMPRPVFVSVNVIGFALVLGIAYLCLAEEPSGYYAARIYAIIMILNGLLHIVMMAIKRAYFPGGLTAFLILPAAVNLIYQLSRS